ncbi:MAG: RNA-binding S4 domain-containing protein [Bacteroidaceae bacterium]|nr:RNA-binding S4 domain-containing protein [Bacteroidaceae bacterium]MBQ8008876.1 RNA-binding S4 domain-containing protein [Bacteroidaceae bacterium]MBR1541432.1 RNA-binding S4 domain-containing protein [Bacteroidaceae bacterium]
MITEDEKWQNAEPNGNAEGNQFEKDGYNRGSRPQRVYSNDRPYRPRFNPNAENNRPQRSYYNSGEQRPFRPRFNANEGGEQRPYRPRFNANEGGEQRPYRPRYNNDENGEQRTYRPRYNNAEGGEQRPYRPRFNNNGGGYNNSERPYRPRFNNDENGEQRPYRPRYNNDDNGEQRSFRPRVNQNGGGRYGKPARPAQRKGSAPKSNNHRPIEYTEVYTPDDEIRLNKFLANAGICSRREADEYIQAGVVTVNGEVVTELGTKIKRGDEVKFHDQPVSIERKVYVLLNKPKDCVTTTDDPQARKTVMDIVKGACPERIYPVGRLDRNTTGVILLTNDGELASKLTHPKFDKKKIYRVRLDKDLTKEDMDKIAAGVKLEDGEIHADEIAYADDSKKNDIGIEIHSGKNRIVRRIFEHLGYKVTKLDRVFFAGLTKKGLKRGDWRFLTQQEVNFLRMGSFE